VHLSIRTTPDTTTPTYGSSQPNSFPGQNREIIDKSVVDPLAASLTGRASFGMVTGGALSPPSSVNATPARTTSFHTGAVKNNGFNPVWQEVLCLLFDCVGDMMDLAFVRFAVEQEGKADVEALAFYCSSLGCLEQWWVVFPLLCLFTFCSSTLMESSWTLVGWQVSGISPCTIHSSCNIYSRRSSASMMSFDTVER
jgi:hypothetical protein